MNALKKDCFKEIKKDEPLDEDIPEEYKYPHTLEIFFEGNLNKIKSPKNSEKNEQIKKIASFLKEHPSIKIELIANTSDEKSKKIDTPIPSGKVNEEFKTGVKLSGKNTTRDLMLIRAHRIKILFEKLGVDDSQLFPKEGNCLGEGESNRKITIEFFKQ